MFFSSSIRVRKEVVTLKRNLVRGASLIAAVGLMLNINSAAADSESPLEEIRLDEKETGDDRNHTETISKIQAYIDEHVPDTFASLHIDREENPSGKVVLSFTEEISPEVKEEIKALANDPDEVSFRLVPYTEDELLLKQSEVDKAIFGDKVFQDERFSVSHTSTDIINHKVEIGILPFNEEAAQQVKDYFGDEMIQVVAGHEAQTLTEEKAEDDENTGFWTKFLSFLSNLFGQ